MSLGCWGGFLFTFALLAPAFAPVALAECTDSFCHTDEASGDTSTPCQDGIGNEHDPRYRYMNASYHNGDYVLTASLIFACESTGVRGEYFWGNVTITDGDRVDQIRAYYYYGEIYGGVTCAAWVDVDPDLIKVPNGPGLDAVFRFGGGYRDTCPDPGYYPSVVSTLP